MSIDKLFKIFTPKDSTFFPLFEEDVANLVKIAELLCQLMNSQDASHWVPLIKQIKELERTGDHITNRIYDNLDKSFITPFDREDIQSLASSIDDVADNINRACNRIMLYKPKMFMAEFALLADLILQGSRLIDIGIKDIKKSDSNPKLTDICIQISEIENKADDIYHSAISRLFEEEADPIELIKIKDILKSLERATDDAKTVSNVFKTIVIKRT
jgi:predicted phosphate transport protein (TIGR00153 family)